jgi:putative membrane protein
MQLHTRRILTGVILVALATVLGSARPAAAVAQGTAPKLDDPTIVAIFDAANTYDMETGSLAISKGHSKAVRDFGSMLVRDHRNVRAQGRELAKSLKVTPTPPRNFALAKAHVAAMRSLRNAKGSAFDRAFLQHEVDYHNAVIDAVNTTLLPATQNAQLKDLETKVAPAFVAHRDRAQSLLNGLK